jgi:hypothetical protein
LDAESEFLGGVLCEFFGMGGGVGTSEHIANALPQSGGWYITPQ